LGFIWISALFRKIDNISFLEYQSRYNFINNNAAPAVRFGRRQCRRWPTRQIPVSVLQQQIHVRRVVHPLISGRCREKVPTHFESMQNSHCASVGCIVAE
jgi:hypothetical protein